MRLSYVAVSACIVAGQMLTPSAYAAPSKPKPARLHVSAAVFPSIAEDQTRPIRRRLSTNAVDPDILIPPETCEPTETSCHNDRPCQTGTVHVDKKCSRDAEGFYYCSDATGRKCGALDKNNDGITDKCATCT